MPILKPRLKRCSQNNVCVDCGGGKGGGRSSHSPPPPSTLLATETSAMRTDQSQPILRATHDISYIGWPYGVKRENLDFNL